MAGRDGRCAAAQGAVNYGRCSRGRVAQLAEHLLCKQGVRGSNPLTSTNHLPAISITYYEAGAGSFSASG